MLSATASPGKLRLKIKIATPEVSMSTSNEETWEPSSLPKYTLRRFPGLLPQITERKKGVEKERLSHSIGRSQGYETAAKPRVGRRLSGIPICPSLVRRSNHRHLRSISPKATQSPLRLSLIRSFLKVADITQKRPYLRLSRYGLVE